MPLLSAAPALIATVTQLLLGLCCVCAPVGEERCHHPRETTSSAVEAELSHLCDSGHQHQIDCQFHSGAFVSPEQFLKMAPELNHLLLALPTDQGNAGQQLGLRRADRLLGSPHGGLHSVPLHLLLGVLLV